jgi:hypothetical protein
MAQRTDGQLTTEANIIRDETAVGANTALRVGTMLDNLIDSKVNIDRVSNSASLGNSTTLVPSQNAVKTYVDAFATGLLTDNGNYDPTITSEYPTSGNTLSGGAVQKGDIWFIDTDGTMNGNPVFIGYSVRALIDNAVATTDADWSISNVGIGYVPENVANKSFDAGMGDSDVYYPSQKAVRDYVLNQIALSIPSYPLENSNNKIQNIALDPTSSVKYPSNAAVSSFVAANLPSGWWLAGNAGTTPGTDFIGTTDAKDLIIKTNNTQRVIIGSTGDITTLNNLAAVKSSGNAITCTDGLFSYAALINDPSTADGGYLYLQNNIGVATSLKATNLTSARTHQLPDASGTVALTSDITTFTRKFSITNGQLLTIGSTAINLFPSGDIPAGKILIPVSISFKYNYNTTPFTANTSLNVGYWTGSGSITLMTTNILSYGSTYCEFTNMANVAVPIGVGFDGGNIRIFQSTFANPVGGGGFLEVIVTYNIQSL